MNRGAPLAALSALTLLAAACARHAPPHSRAPSIVLIVVDTLRADHLPAYGYRGVETPAIDRLRRDAVLFENAYAHAPLTLPSHASLLTGLLPYQNGVRDNIGFRLSETHATLATRLKALGYATGAAVSTFALRRDRGLAAGFDFYDDHFDASSPDERAGVRTAAILSSWIEKTGSGPFLAFLHLYEPHTPYAPPEPYRSRYRTAPYDGEIAAADEAVGRFLDDLRGKGLYDPALIVFLSDHGEGLNDHGEDEHGVFLYRETLRVPLMIKHPGGRGAGGTVRRPVGLVDVFPTALETAGAREASGGPGVSLSAGSVPAGRAIYSETLYPRLQLGWSDLASMTDERFSYIEAPRPELYDLASDPRESRNLAETKPPPLRVLKSALDALKRPDARAEPAGAEELRRLGSLGYVHVEAGARGNLPDPKDRVEALRRYKRLFDAFYARRDAEAIALSRQILAEEPRILSAWRIQASSLERAGKRREAAEVLRAALSRPDIAGTEEDLAQTVEQLASTFRGAGDSAACESTLRQLLGRGIAVSASRRELARILTESGRAREALPLLEGEVSPDAEALDLRGVALAEAGRLAEARAALRRALELDPGSAKAAFHLGTLSLREKDAASARTWLERSLASKPDSPATLTALGLAQAGTGDDAGALASWKRAVALDPTQYDALFNLGILAGRTGQLEESRGDLERFVATAPPARYPTQLAEARRLLRSLDAPARRAAPGGK